jgi:hypothetical protein
MLVVYSGPGHINESAASDRLKTAHIQRYGAQPGASSTVFNPVLLCHLPIAAPRTPPLVTPQLRRGDAARTRDVTCNRSGRLTPFFFFFKKKKRNAPGVLHSQCMPLCFPSYREPIIMGSIDTAPKTVAGDDEELTILVTGFGVCLHCCGKGISICLFLSRMGITRPSRVSAHVLAR